MGNIVQLRKCQGNYWALCRETIQKNFNLRPRGTKRKKKPSCLPLVSFPFLLDTQPAPAHEPCRRYSENGNKAGWTQLIYPFLLYNSLQCLLQRGNKLKTHLKEHQYIWQLEHFSQTHFFSNNPPMQKIRLDFLLGILHWNGPVPSKGGSNCWLIFYCLAMF